MAINSQLLKSNFLLVLTAMIWGFAFVAQRAGMEYVGPFTFNGIRFALGAFSLLPLVLIHRRRKIGYQHVLPEITGKMMTIGGIVAGLALFLGSSFQQVGIVYTTAGKAGFITGLYVIIVPIIGIFWKQRIGAGNWFAALLAIAGLYLLSIHGTFKIAIGDLLVFISAFFWAAHVHVIGWFSAKMDSLELAFLQFTACSVFSLLVAILWESFVIESILQAAIPILYAGLFSVGVAYTLQVVGQKHAPPANAAIILSLESVFAVLGGWLLLSEGLSLRGIFGCILMLGGMILSQIQTSQKTIPSPVDS